MSYLFDAAGEKIELANAPAAAPAQFTMIAWVKLDSFVGVRGTVLAHYHDANDKYCGLYVNGTFQAIGLWASFSSSNGQWRGPSSGLSTGAWLGLAVSYDSSNVANDPVFYVKPEGGAIAVVATTELVAPSGTPAAMDSIYLGGIFSTYNLTGRIAYAREFTSILTQAEIDTELSNAAAQLAAEIDLPLVDDALDDSGNAHNGTVTGATLDADNPTLGGGGGGGGNGHVYQRRMRRFFLGI